MAKRATKNAAVDSAEASTALTTFKGFGKDWKCRDYQYQLGKTYEHAGSVVRCAGGGFHSCEMPLDVLNYYPPNTSRFAEVIADGAIDKGSDDDDSKLASAKITINVELSLGELTRRAVRWVADMAKKQGNGQHTTGNYGHASAAGYRGHASAAGYRGHASAAGYRGHASAAGDGGHASAAGNGGHASAAGDGGHASAAGDGGHASAAGYRGHASAAGDGGHASAAGNGGHASAAGDGGHASAAGDGGHASAAGYRGHASAAGDGGHAEVKGTCAVAHAPGVGGMATAVAGSAISLAYHDESVWPPKLIAVRSSMVGENGIEAGKKYRLTKAGEFEAVED
ncbi:DUF7666 domain-containing protein [Rhizobium esperanzae]|uniref:DUF7666 domain-containing protein n=1 Tax=Rhizobium esperanzae TaxID=1967781 RepID=A0A7W6R1K1_9HYPH|nr:hypothetical protein [Rhizobium esperanzae]MBB4235098.1 hypothetical protein [Rhizobium esperanzae]